VDEVMGAPEEVSVPTSGLGRTKIALCRWVVLAPGLIG
jgi:hypothetical protein